MGDDKIETLPESEPQTKIVVIETDVTEGEDHFVIHSIGRQHYWSFYHKGKCCATNGPYKTKTECMKAIRNLVNNIGNRKVIYVKQSEYNRTGH